MLRSVFSSREEGRESSSLSKGCLTDCVFCRPTALNGALNGSSTPLPDQTLCP
ncbi:hypothetical protein ACKFKG_18340 [Phormidesmis sp. 146-35]